MAERERLLREIRPLLDWLAEETLLYRGQVARDELFAKYSDAQLSSFSEEGLGALLEYLKACRAEWDRKNSGLNALVADYIQEQGS
ncbi:MAG: hypothetical protein JW990_11775 [Thermoleophilia bacterium]|nr:hypothetical protein [Thermoleophilia bacterium]